MEAPSRKWMGKHEGRLRELRSGLRRDFAEFMEVALKDRPSRGTGSAEENSEWTTRIESLTQAAGLKDLQAKVSEMTDSVAEFESLNAELQAKLAHREDSSQDSTKRTLFVDSENKDSKKKAEENSQSKARIESLTQQAAELKDLQAKGTDAAAMSAAERAEETRRSEEARRFEEKARLLEMARRRQEMELAARHAAEHAEEMRLFEEARWFEEKASLLEVARRLEEERKRTAEAITAPACPSWQESPYGQLRRQPLAQSNQLDATCRPDDGLFGRPTQGLAFSPMTGGLSGNTRVAALPLSPESPRGAEARESALTHAGHIGQISFLSKPQSGISVLAARGGQKEEEEQAQDMTTDANISCTSLDLELAPQVKGGRIVAYPPPAPQNPMIREPSMFSSALPGTWQTYGHSSGIQKLDAISSAKAWVVQAQESPLQRQKIYPCGACVNVMDWSSKLAPLININIMHRSRMVPHLEAGDHVRTALQTYFVCDKESHGYLALNGGFIHDFINKSFRQMGVNPPLEEHTSQLFVQFENRGSDKLDALQCLSLFDALMRIAFATDIPSLSKAAASPGSRSTMPQVTASPFGCPYAGRLYVPSSIGMASSAVSHSMSSSAVSHPLYPA